MGWSPPLRLRFSPGTHVKRCGSPNARLHARKDPSLRTYPTSLRREDSETPEFHAAKGYLRARKVDIFLSPSRARSDPVTMATAMANLTFAVTHVTPREIAEQLTYLESQMFSAIEAREW